MDKKNITNIEDALWMLETFNWNVDRILESDYAKEELENSITVSCEYGILSSTHKKPTDETLTAMFAMVRLFYQDNDVSICNLSRIYQKPEFVPDRKLTNEFLECRDELNCYLDNPTWIIMNGKKANRRTIFENFGYGHYGHTDNKKILDNAKLNPEFYNMVHSEFIDTLAVLIDCTAYMKGFNNKAIADMKSILRR